MPSFDSDALIEALKRRINIPTAQGLYSEADFLRILDEELHGRVVPFYLSQREDFFLTYSDTTLDSTVTAIDIPVRAIGQKFSDINYIQPGGTTPEVQTDMVLVSPGERNSYGYYTQDNRILLSFPFSAGKLRIYYYRRPAHLASTANAPAITVIAGNDITVSEVPSDWTTGTLVDFVGSAVPFKAIGDDYAITGIAGTVISFASLPSGLAVGDYVGKATEAPVAQIPIDAINYLIAAGAVRILQGTNYGSAYQIAVNELQRIEKDLAVMVTPRADRDLRKINNRAFSTVPAFYYRGGGRL